MPYFACPHCQRSIDPDDVVGNAIECPRCGKVVSPPRKSHPSKLNPEPRASGMPIVVCPGCERRLKIPFDKINSFVRCAACQCRFNPSERRAASLDVPSVPMEPDDGLNNEDDPEQEVTIAVGRNGQVELLESSVVIRRKGVVAFLTQGIKGEKQIQLSAITGTEFKRNGALVAGYIRFIYMGNDDWKGGVFFNSSPPKLLGADENAVIFGTNAEDDFYRLKLAIEKRITQLKDGSVRAAPTGSVADELKKLVSLRDAGDINQAEYLAMKRRLLNRS